ncbi:unnamed protein product [Fraxinus pennsylvanica]|uniref:RING-type E3 ubiquitin transferase n=1 Tax=Fraxinus pennsylvanica TaxID=56036 RepID=A0AAD2DLR4_9LAMI|nr:unnamed protein product [Fraxinus pennsylvanica]
MEEHDVTAVDPKLKEAESGGANSINGISKEDFGKLLIGFEAIYPTLKEVSLASSLGSKAMKQVSQQIQTLAVKAAGEVPDAHEVDKSSFKHRSPVIPDDFRCPISLELMKDPVIMSTGQTYEWSCIEKWLNASHKTCPKTQQTLFHTALTPNYVLKSLIALWCENENKVAIGAAGAIPPLIDLLCHGTPRGKKDAATAIFNLLIYQGNKVRAVRARIVPPLMRLLKDPGGGMVDEALAILAILASHQEGKVAIGQAEPITILIEVIKTVASELGAEEALKELSENGTDRAKRKARNVLKLLQRAEDIIG